MERRHSPVSASLISTCIPCFTHHHHHHCTHIHTYTPICTYIYPHIHKHRNTQLKINFTKTEPQTPWGWRVGSKGLSLVPSTPAEQFTVSANSSSRGIRCLWSHAEQFTVSANSSSRGIRCCWSLQPHAHAHTYTQRHITKHISLKKFMRAILTSPVKTNAPYMCPYQLKQRAVGHTPVAPILGK